MLPPRLLTLVLLSAFVLTLSACGTARSERWSNQKAQQWYAQYPWLVGANYNPATAINQFEMWRAEDFDPETIDKELGYAEEIGFNCMRVYLHDQLWAHDPEGLIDRMEQYLAIADKHGIVTMFVLLDDVWRPDFTYDQQFEPVPGRHNSYWLQSPGGPKVENYADDPELQAHLEDYVKGILTHFKNDKRIFAWDLLNEPANRSRYADNTSGPETYEGSFALVKDLFKWGWEVDPSQPLTVCHWQHNEFRDALSRYSCDNSDVVTYHNYSGPENLEAHTKNIIKLADGRPVICTEYMARTNNSTFQGSLPIFAKYNVGAIHWGFVAGRSNTIYPWSSWETPGKLPEPDVWFHDVIRPDGSPYDQDELNFIKKTIRETRAASGG